MFKKIIINTSSNSKKDLYLKIYFWSNKCLYISTGGNMFLILETLSTLLFCFNNFHSLINLKIKWGNVLSIGELVTLIFR